MFLNHFDCGSLMFLHGFFEGQGKCDFVGEGYEIKEKKRGKYRRMVTPGSFERTTGQHSRVPLRCQGSMRKRYIPTANGLFRLGDTGSSHCLRRRNAA